MANSKKIKLSVIILSWNTKDLLRQCLESLIFNFQFLIFNYEIIVVDNGSVDGSQEYLKTQSANWRTKFKATTKNLKLKLILNKRNLGFAKGNNQALRQAQGGYVMLLNSDTVVKKGALEKLVEFLDENPQVGAVSPLLLNPVNPDGRPQIDYYMKFPNLWQVFLYHNPALRPLVMRTPLRWLVVSRGNKQSLICLRRNRGNGGDKGFEVDQLPGAALMARGEVWQKVGPLNEDYQFLYEDVDWCWRAKKLGFRLVVVPQAEIVHIGGASWKKKLKENSFEFYRQFFSSMLLFVKKNYGFSKCQVFRLALVTHFLVTFKPRFAFWFIVAPSRQKKLWQ